MFHVRDAPASAEEVARQELMWSVVRGEPVLGDTSSSSSAAALQVAHAATVKKKTAAIYGHRQIDPLRRARIYKALDTVLERLVENTTETTTDKGDADVGDGGEVHDDDVLDEQNVRRRLKSHVESIVANTTLDAGDVVHLSVRPPILAYTPEPAATYDFKLPVRATTGVSLFAFELFAFDNRVIYQFYEGVTFSTYFYHNAVYSLGVSDSTVRLEQDGRWQARLALLIKRTDFSDFVSMGAFYEDSVRYRGVGYDTSFVPDYDVYSLRPASRIGCSATVDSTAPRPPRPPPPLRCTNSKCVNHKSGNSRDHDGDGDETADRNTGHAMPGAVTAVAVEKLLTYRATMDARRADRVPPEYMSVFLTFPFKDGHYVRPADGTLTYLNVGRPRRASVTAIVHRICDVSTLEQDVADAARSLRLRDVLAYAVHAERLESQGVALLILRQMIGNTIKVNEEKIRLPYADEVLGWLARHCENNKGLSGGNGGGGVIVLPKGGGGSVGNANSVATAVAMIRDIAACVQSKLAAAFVCSSFHLMESDYRDAYERLTTDAELYVFFTLILQQYNVGAYRTHRDALDPKFGDADGDVHRAQYNDPVAYLAAKYRVYARPYKDTTVQSRLDAFTEPLVLPTDVSATTLVSHSCTDACAEKYEFADAQLAELATTGTVELTREQIAAYITLCVS